MDINSGNDSESRLNKLRLGKFLSHRIIRRLSENMHYEVFKYLPPKDLLEIRIMNLGGYELISNKILRPRIGNYFHQIQPIINTKELANIMSFDHNLKFIFQQLGREILDLDLRNLGESGAALLLPILKLNPELKEIKLGIIYNKYNNIWI